MKLQIYYDPESDTLDIGNGQPTSEGYDVADQLTAHVDSEGDVVFVTLEHAAEVLAPYLSWHIADAIRWHRLPYFATTASRVSHKLP